MLLMNPRLRISFTYVAKQLHMTERTLRRKLREEETSFRKIIDELRMHVAIRYLRDTYLTVEEVADSLGFSDDASFRLAFRRWTHPSPLEFRTRSRGALRKRVTPPGLPQKLGPGVVALRPGDSVHGTATLAASIRRMAEITLQAGRRLRVGHGHV